MSGTNWHSFSTGQLGRADQVNENFDWLEGHIVPMNGGTKQNILYSLGGSGQTWRSIHIGTALVIGASQTVASVDNVTMEVSSGAFRLKNGGIRGSTANSGGSAREIAQGTVSTPDLRTNAVYSPTLSASGSGAAGTTITAVALTVENNPILVCGFVNMQVSGANPSADVDVDVLLVRHNMADATSTFVTGGKLNHTIFNVGIASMEMQTFRLAYIDQPGAGNFKYELRYTVNTGLSITTSPYSLFMVELKR